MSEECLRLRFKLMFKNIHMQVQVLKGLQNKQPKNNHINKKIKKWQTKHTKHIQECKKTKTY
jgi:hypothetical protein